MSLQKFLKQPKDGGNVPQTPLGPVVDTLRCSIPVPGKVFLVHDSRDLSTPFWHAIVYGLWAVHVVEGAAAVEELKLQHALTELHSKWAAAGSKRVPSEADSAKIVKLLSDVSSKLSRSDV
jgi:hypothetical protein